MQIDLINSNEKAECPKNWCFWIAVLKKTLEIPLNSKEIKSVNPKDSQPWIFFGRAEAEVETPILWPQDAKSQLIGMRMDAGKDWEQEEKRTRKDEMVGWHQWLNGHEFEQIQGESEGQAAWCAAVHELSKSQTQLSSWTTSEIRN